MKQILLVKGDDRRLHHSAYIGDTKKKLKQIIGGIGMGTSSQEQDLSTFLLKYRSIQAAFLENPPLGGANVDHILPTKASSTHSTARGPTCTVYFVQREDGVICVIPARRESNIRPILSLHLDPSIEAEVIVCQVPAHEVCLYVEKPLALIGSHNPSHESRISALSIVAEQLQARRPITDAYANLIGNPKAL